MNKKIAGFGIALVTVGVILGAVTYYKRHQIKSNMSELDLTKTSNEFYLNEDEYEQQMNDIVKPYLAEYKKESYFTPVEGIEIYYQSYVQKKSAASVVISHGFTESSDKYEEVIYYFLKQGYSVYIMDHRGHGYSTRQVEDLSLVYVEDFEDYVHDFGTFVKTVVKPEIGDQTCYLYAHSMGGGIATRVLQEYPDLFDKAVLSSPMMGVQTGYPKFISKIVANVATMIGKAENYVFGHYAFDGIRDFAAFSSTSESRFNYYFDKLLSNEMFQTYGASFAWLKQCLYGTDTMLEKSNLAKITTPILMFQAEYDTLVKASAHYQFASQVALTDLVFVKNAKHELYSTGNDILIPYFNTIFEFLTIN